MKLLAVASLSLIANAAAQQTSDPLNDLISRLQTFVTRRTTQVPIETTAGIGTSSSSLTTSALLSSRPTSGGTSESRNFIESPTVSTSTLSGTTTSINLSASTSITASASTASPTIVSDTGIPSITIFTNVPPFTVASTGSSSPVGGSNGSADRVAVVALATILGALVFGIFILLLFICHRRRKHGSKQHGMNSSRGEKAAPAATARRHRPASWIGSIRTSRRAQPNATPLMSEGSPRYGFFSPKFPRRMEGQAQLRPIKNTEFLGADQRSNAQPDQTRNQARQQARKAPAGIDAMLASTKQSPMLQQLQNTSEHDIGNPHVDQAPRTPNLTPGSFDTIKANPGAIVSKFSSARHSPASAQQSSSFREPRRSEIQKTSPDRKSTKPSSLDASQDQSAPLDVPPKDHDARSVRSTSVTREGFASAIAGLGLQSTQSDIDMPQESAVPKVTHTEGDSMLERQPLEPVLPASTSTTYPEMHPVQQQSSSGSQHWPVTPRLDIPAALLPGRTPSKQTGLGVVGDVSPQTETAPSIDSARRLSAVSPVSPERGAGTLRSYLDRYPSIRAVLPATAGTANGSSSTAASGTPPVTGRNRSSSLRRLLAPLGGKPPAQIDSRGQPSTPGRGGMSGLKRKPVPLNLSNLSQKPLPVPIPTSKFQYKDLARPQPALASASKSNFEIDATVGQSQEADERRRTWNNKARPTSKIPVLVHPPLAAGRADGNGQSQKPNSSQPRKRTSIEPVAKEQRASVGWWKDPDNHEHAQIYGRYYSQPSPMRFPNSAEPTPRIGQFPTTVPSQYVSPTLQESAPPKHQIRTSYSPAQYQSATHASYPQPSPRYAQPPATAPLARTTTTQTSSPESQMEHQHPLQQHPYVPTDETPPAPPPRGYLHVPSTFVSTYAAGLGKKSRSRSRDSKKRTRKSAPVWRDSHYDAWRDSLSRSGSEGTDQDVDARPGQGRHRSISEGSSGAGEGTGLWGSPGFFGIDDNGSKRGNGQGSSGR